MDEIVYPPSIGCPISDKSEADFRREFTGVVATLIARHFFSYDSNDNVAVRRPRLPALIAALRPSAQHRVDAPGYPPSPLALPCRLA